MTDSRSSILELRSKERDCLLSCHFTEWEDFWWCQGELKLTDYLNHLHKMFSGACMYPGNDFPDNIYLFKVNDWNTKKKCEICLKLTMKAPVWCFYCRFCTSKCQLGAMQYPHRRQTNMSVTDGTAFSLFIGFTVAECHKNLH